MSRAEACEAFARLLSSAPAPRVVVSVRDFPALVRRCRVYQLAGFTEVRKGQAAHDRPTSAGGYVEPADEIQRRLAEIWQEELGIAQVGMLDDFFALGGDSLSAVKLVSRMRPVLRVPITVRTVYDAPTIGALTDYAASLRWAADATVAADEAAEEGVL
jgi:acyl carrier protein